MTDSDWKVFHTDELIRKRVELGLPYMEFLRVPDLSCGIYHLRAGAKDLQTPHDEDEVYYVVSGRARVKVGDRLEDVSAGSILYVRATARHSFVEIEEDITLVVFFASGGPDESES